MKIVHIGPACEGTVLYRFGGAIERRIMELARCQTARGRSVLVYSTGSAVATRVVDGVEVRFLRCAAPYPIRHIEFLFRALQDLRTRKEKPDALHFHGQPEGAVLSRGLRGVKVLSYDSFYFRRGRETPLEALYRRWLRRFDWLLPCSQYCLDESAAYWDLPLDRIRLVHNGVNLEQFRPDPAGGALEREARGIRLPVVLYVGRVCAQKGTQVLLDAFRRISRRRSDVQLVVAGPIEQFASRASPAAWQARIADVGGRYLGAVAEDRLARVYNMADLYVLPTVRFEMFGMAAVEAQACGVPVIASDHGGLRETVPSSSGGRFPVGDDAALAERIVQLIDDQALRRSCAANAALHARRYAWPVICDTLDPIYDGSAAADPRRFASDAARTTA
jgi:glycosyltransferase involved in cell wall biosynthesis